MTISTASFYLKVRDNASGYYSNSRGKVMVDSPFSSQEEAEDVRRVMMNGAEFEVMPA